LRRDCDTCCLGFFIENAPLSALRYFIRDRPAVGSAAGWIDIRNLCAIPRGRKMTKTTLNGKSNGNHLRQSCAMGHIV
ncbi:MAG TPA: hypothetical protein PLX99_13005, partial [Gammaproteobacteria bacterium]|nr:hypothetical protein [Gammaproteobacteria bacterium]